MDYSGFKKLIAFFSALKDSGFKTTLKEIPGSTIIDKVRTPVDKNYCLQLLRSFPEFQRDVFKNDNNIVKYLSDPRNRDRILGRFTPKLRIELEKLLAKIPVATKGIIYQQGQGPIEQAAPVDTTTGAATGGMPSMPSVSTPAIHPIYRSKPPAPPVQQVQKPEIVIANKSGAAAEKPPSEFHVADKSGNITATYSKEPMPAAAQPKLVLARSDGSIIKPATPPPTIAIADSRGNIVREHTIPTRGKFNFSSLKSSVSSGFKKVQNFASPAGPFLKVNLGRIGNGLKSMFGGVGRSIAGPGLTGLANLGGRAGLGAINHGGNFLSNLSGAGANVKSRLSAGVNSLSPRNMGSKRALWLFGSIFFLIFFMGLAGGMTGTTPSTDTTPGTTIKTDISNCKFTRGAETPKETTIKSSLLLSFIQEASQKSTMPAVVLASFIRVESPASSDMSDNQITNYAANCAVSSTGALGIMQIQPPGTKSAAGDPASCDDCIDAGAKLVGKTVSTLTKADYCDPRTNIIVGAGWILKKMSKLGYGDGTKWDPTWTTDSNAIKALVNTYYGCLQYGGATDCTGPYSYATDVQTSIQNCQVSSPGTNPPPPATCANNNYKSCIENQYHITFDDRFGSEKMGWAWDILNAAYTKKSNLPKLITTNYSSLFVVPDPSGSHTDGNIISLRPTYDLVTFNLIFMHELGHAINGSRPGIHYGEMQTVIQQDGGYLTLYSQNAASSPTAYCGDGSIFNRADEDFAETFTYFVNYNTPETPYSAQCPVPTSGTNPFSGGKHPYHLQYIQGLQ